MNIRFFKQIVLSWVFCWLFLSGTSAFGGTIVGTVNDNYQIIGNDNKIYEIGESDAGHEVSSMVGKIVSVQGTVEQVDDANIIIISSYEIIGEKPDEEKTSSPPEPDVTDGNEIIK